jgi:hypothetical protein
MTRGAGSLDCGRTFILEAFLGLPSTQQHHGTPSAVTIPVLGVLASATHAALS